MPTATLTASNMAGLLTAIDAAHATDPATDWTIELEDGDYSSPSGKTFISGKVFAGQVLDPNVSKPIASRTQTAIASLVGGSVRIRAKNHLGVKISDLMQTTGSGPFAWVGIDFTAQATADGGLQPDGTYVKGQSHSKAQLRHTSNNSYPTKTSMVVRNCRFGGMASDTPIARWIMGCMTQDSATTPTYIEDSEFWGSVIAGTATVTRRNVVRKQVTDGFRMGFGAGPQPDMESYENTIYDSSNDPIWFREHCDAIQVGSVNTDNPIKVTIYGNVICSSAKMQGIYMDDSHSTISGLVQDNLIVVTNTNGINLWNPTDMTLLRNTVVTYPDGDPTQNSVIIRTGTVGTNVLIQDCIAMNDPSASNKPFLTLVGHTVVPKTAAGYNATFMESFGTSGAPLAMIDFTQPASALRADLLARFTRR